MAHQLPELPYGLDALEPHISRQTLEFHHGKHHAAYVTNLNKLIEGGELEGKSLEEVILAVAGDAAKAGVFNNAAQVWNHSFYWQCIKPGGGGAPTGALAEKIAADFGSFEAFVEQFKAAGATQFGPGPGWSSMAAPSRSPRPPTPICPWPMVRRLCSPWMSGSTPTTSTTRTAVPTT